MDVLTLAFMQRALLAAVVTGLTAPAIGTYLVQRRLSLLGDGLGHLAVAGVGLAFLTGAAPLPLAVLVCVAGAVGIELLREMGRTSGDVGLAILFYGGLSGGLLLAGLAGQGTGALSAYLFGSLLTINATELWIIAGLAAVVLLVCLGLLPQLFAVSADEPFARTIGLPVRFYNVLVVALAAVTVTVSMRTVGLLLVSALMVVPVATANHLVIGFRRSMLVAMGLGVLAAVSGTLGSFQLDTAPGALIVVIAIGLFALSVPVSAWLARRRASDVELVDTQPPRSHEVTEEEHPHVHAEGCGHLAVQHGAHVDYIHDGHRHAAHEGHYDEH